MTVRLEITGDTARDVLGVVFELAQGRVPRSGGVALVTVAGEAQTVNDGPTQVEPSPTTVTSDAATSDKPKRGRKPAVEAPATVETPKTGEIIPTLDAVRVAMKTLAGTAGKGMEALEAVMTAFNVTKASDVPDADRAKFIAKCAEMEKA